MSKRKPMIAVVDDDPSVCRAIKRLIRSLGMDAETFTSGQDFFELLESMPSLHINCVIIDVQMPGMSGIAVQEKLAHLGKSLPVIFITAHDELVARERALLGGAIAFLRKPFSDQLLIKTLDVALGGDSVDTDADRQGNDASRNQNGGGSMKKKLIIGFAMLFHASVALGDVYIYPNKGQSQQQQSKDRYECHSWAVQQTGFDPSQPPPAATAASPSGGEVIKGSARGALVGTVGGAIAGNAGRGAAAGAAMGGLLGGMRKMDKAKAQQQQQNYAAQARAAYDRAQGACLEGRGYTVR